MVNVSSELTGDLFKSVTCDNVAIGRMAAQFFLERGFRHFGFLGLPNYQASAERFDSFSQLLLEKGFSVHVPPALAGANLRAYHDWEAYLKILVTWVSSLPRPVALFGFSDLRASDLLQACFRAGIQVPGEAAVLGVDNDPLICEISYPPLASIDPGFQHIGFSAAELLDQIMQGREVSPEPIRQSPVGIHVRLSADLVAVSDPQVARAVRFIRDHIGSPFQVKDILSEAPMARRTLEQRFRRALGRSIHEEIQRARIEHAKTLLENSNLPLDEIALRSGFKYQAHLSTIFKKHTGQPPGTYRRRNRIDRKLDI